MTQPANPQQPPLPAHPPASYPPAPFPPVAAPSPTYQPAAPSSGISPITSYPAVPQPVPMRPQPPLTLQTPPSTPPQTLAPRRKSRGALAAIIVLSLLTVAAIGLGGYFWLAADRWQSTAVAWEQQARAHGEQVADLTVELESSRGEVATAQQHLESAQARITELANERAQLGDQQIVDQSLLDFQQRLSVAAGQVASSLDICISRQDELIEALRNPGRYTEESVAHFGAQVVQFCAEARNANTNLQTEINR